MVWSTNSFFSNTPFTAYWTCFSCQCDLHPWSYIVTADCKLSVVGECQFNLPRPVPSVILSHVSVPHFCICRAAGSIPSSAILHKVHNTETWVLALNLMFFRQLINACPAFPIALPPPPNTSYCHGLSVSSESPLRCSWHCMWPSATASFRTAPVSCKSPIASISAPYGCLAYLRIPPVTSGAYVYFYQPPEKLLRVPNSYMRLAEMTDN